MNYKLKLTEIQKKLLNEFKNRLPELENKAKNIKGLQTNLITFPVCLSSLVIDSAIWNVKKQKFISLELQFAKDGIVLTDILPENTAYCATIEIVTIPL
jgi:hypothetical protein